jgi:DNA-3-methyladenine glycosylase
MSAHCDAPAATALRALPRRFYQRDTVAVARELLGTYLVHVQQGVERVGRIVEVEAYLGPHDLAAHSSKGLTARNRSMFGPAGHAYVYMIYGVHFCMNVVTGGAGQGSAVLLRALEPVRNVTGRTQGPGLLCKAMHIDRRLDGHDLLSDALFVAAAQPPGAGGRARIACARRIGVDYAGPWSRRLLRFYLKGNPFVSRS